MKSWWMNVRAGAGQSALGRRLALVTGVGVLLVVAGRATSSIAQQRLEPLSVQADTALVNALLQRVRTVDPTICYLLGQPLDNRWGSWHGAATDPRAAGADVALLEWLDSGRMDRGLVPPLRSALNDADACVRHTAAQLLGRVHLPDLSVELAAELGSAKVDTRVAALLALGYFDKPSGSAEAQAALRDADASVRRTAAWALGHIGDAEAVPALVEVLQTDRDPLVRRAAAAALGQISG